MTFAKNPVRAGLGTACAVALAVAILSLNPASAGLPADEIRYAKVALDAAEKGDYKIGRAHV